MTRRPHARPVREESLAELMLGLAVLVGWALFFVVVLPALVP